MAIKTIFRKAQTTTSFKKKLDKQFEYFDKKLKFEDFIRDYEPKKINEIQLTEQDVKDAYTALLKTTKADQTFNCGACGYNSCEQMAIAVAKGINVVQNCHQFSVRNANVATQEAIAANDAIKAQNRLTMDVIGDIIGNVDLIRDNTNYIGVQCENNKSSMDDVEKKLELFRRKCNDISEAIKGIIHVNDLYNKMAESIRSITEQTHILSLNASVESARAGAAGKTFQVVASEIRSLAASTKATTRTVADNDELMQNETAKVLKIAKDIEKMVDDLAKVMDEVQAHLNETNRTGEAIENVSESIAASTQELRNMIVQ